MAKLIAINAALVAAVLIAAELIFGYWLWGDALDGLNIFRNVTWQFDVGHLYPRDGTVTYRRDEWGFRGRYGKPQDIDVLVVGGSTTDERFITEGETWPDVMSQCLERMGKPLRVANAGVTGQSTKGFLADFELWFSRVPELKPRYLLAYLGTNDIWATSEVYSYKDDPTRFNEQADVTAETSVRVQRMKMKSALYRLYRTARGIWTAWRAGIAYSLPNGGAQTAVQRFAGIAARTAGQSVRLDAPALAAFRAKTIDRNAKSLDYYRRNLAALVRVAKSWNMRLILVTQRWATYRVEGDTLHGDKVDFATQESYNDITRTACRENDGVDCIDLARGMTFRPGDNYDMVHTTPAGSRRVGEYICRGLADLTH